jgi:hypothetical protein
MQTAIAFTLFFAAATSLIGGAAGQQGYSAGVAVAVLVAA